MSIHKEIWTYLIVTVVAVLIWFWAAGETRREETINYARVEFTVAEPENWVINPKPDYPVTMTIEGSQVALQNAERLLRREPLEVAIPAMPGPLSVDVQAAIEQLDVIRESGVNIRAVEPATIELNLDQIERITARVKPVLQGVTPDGEVTVEPAEVTVAMPSQLRQRIAQPLTLNAPLPRSALDPLQPGVRHTLTVAPELPAGLAAANNVTISPSTVKVSLTIRSRTREKHLDSVRVQLASPPESRDLYRVEIEPNQLQDVTITADADLIRRIETEDGDRITIVAVLHLGLREMERGIESKRISYFMAILPDGTGVQLQGRVGRGGIATSSPTNGGVVGSGESTEMPVIRLRITPVTRQ